MRLFTLELNENCYIEVVLESKSQFLTAELYVKCFLYNETEKYLTYNFMIRDFLESLICKLERGLNNDLYCSDGEKLGYLYNEYFHDFYENKPSSIQFNDFECMSIAEGYPHLNVWIYNDFDKNITLQLTETYYWFLAERKPGQSFIFYKTFIKNYKPKFAWNVPCAVAKKWLKECQLWLSQIEHDEVRYQCFHDQLKAAGKCKECKEEALLKNGLVDQRGNIINSTKGT